MFSTDTPPQARRKSFKAFTKQLVNPIQRVQQQHQPPQPPPSMSDRTADNHQPDNNNHTSQSDRTQQLPPSASLILGQTSKINPRLPRPSSSTITLSSVPYSYAYGAAGSPPQPGAKKSSNSAQTVDTTDSISPRSRSSRGRQTALHPDDMSIASVSSEKTGSEPAQIRYARLNQRLQNTGSANAPSQLLPKVIVPKLTSTHLNDTSVNIASAFERAQLASRLKKNQNSIQKSTSEDWNPSQQNSQHHTRPETIQSTYNQQIPSASIDHEDQNTNTELNQTQQANKKRKKPRRSIDPSYKYRPGDSATSDSEAGEGIADKRLRREKKARLEQEKQENQLGTSKKRTISKRSRTTSRRSNGSEDLTDSDEDTGPGIAATRGRRIPKENQPENTSEKESGERTSHVLSRKKDTNQRIDGRSDMNDDDGSEVEPERPKRQAVQGVDADATPHARKPQPSATYFLCDPEASLPPEAGGRNQSYDQDLTVGTTESSRSALRLSGDSYDFAEEERIVKALGNQTRQQRPPAPGTFLGDDSASGHHRQGSSDNFGRAGSSRERIRSDDHARRSDSGMREIEEIVASSRQTARSKPEKPRVLPLPISHQKNSIPTIVEESAPELRKESNASSFNSIPDSLGTKWGKQLTSLLSHLFRAEFWNRFAWLVVLGSIALALLINSFKTGDINFPLLSLFSSSKRGSSTFSAPTTEIQDLGELIERLKSLESAVTTISVEQQQDSKNLQQSLIRDKRELDYKVGKLELKLEEEEKVRGSLEEKVQRKVELGVKGLRTDLESVIIGHRHDHSQLEKIKQTVEGLGGRLESMYSSNANSVTREEARVMIEQVWSVKGRDGSSVDPEKLKRAVLKSTLQQLEQEGYVTKAEIGKLLESELQVMGTGFEQQLDTKLEKIRQELQAPRSHARKLDGSVGGQMESVQEMIEEAIERYSQDGIGKRDFALYSGGARVIPQLTSNTYEISVKTWSQKFIGLITGAESVIRGRGPITALSPEVELGKCWPIAGPQGHLAVYLSRRILVTEVSIEHVSKSLAYELDSAPREIEVWSIEDSKKLVDIVYDPNLPSRIQTFQVPAHLNYLSENHDYDSPNTNPPADASSAQTPILRQGILFKIKSNHGNPYYTCIYRIRVHGLMESELNLK